MWIDFECSNCGYADEIQLIDVKTQKTIFCHNCKAIIEVIDDEASASTGIDAMNKAVKDLENILNKFGK